MTSLPQCDSLIPVICFPALSPMHPHLSHFSTSLFRPPYHSITTNHTISYIRIIQLVIRSITCMHLLTHIHLMHQVLPEREESWRSKCFCEYVCFLLWWLYPLHSYLPSLNLISNQKIFDLYVFWPLMMCVMVSNDDSWLIVTINRGWSSNSTSHLTQ